MKLAELLQETGRVVNRLPVPVLMSTAAADGYIAAEAAVAAAEGKLATAQAAEAGRMMTPRTTAAKEELDAALSTLEEAEAAADEHTVEFVVESMSSTEWDRLLSQHPPTTAQSKDLALRGPDGRGPSWNPSTFPVAAMAACLKSPEVDSVADVEQLKDSIPAIAWDQIWFALVRVNRGMNIVPPSRAASARTPSSAS